MFGHRHGKSTNAGDVVLADLRKDLCKGPDNLSRDDYDEDDYGEDEDESVISFRDQKFESPEMKKLVALTAQSDFDVELGRDHYEYKPATVFPDWCLKNDNWNNAVVQEQVHSISDILKLDKAARTPDQTATVIKWLMEVWKIAFTMGFKRCGQMLKSFEFITYEAGDFIIKEGERGLTFYIIISGDTEVHKDGIGIVGHLGKGKSFGEVALTQGNDVRTATVKAATKVECVRLHKTNFDFYIRDIQEQEKRENFKVLSDCLLFKTWAKGKIEKMSHSCHRHIYDSGDYIFHQGDESTDVCVIIEGNVNIVKELVILCKNRWPVGLNQWQERTKKIHKPILLKTLGPDEFFGEAGVLNDQPRSTSARATNRCVLLKLDRLEYLHLTSYGKATDMDNSNTVEEEERLRGIIGKYLDDVDVLESVDYIYGGPNSQAITGNKRIFKHELRNQVAEESLSKDMNLKHRGTTAADSTPTSFKHHSTPTPKHSSAAYASTPKHGKGESGKYTPKHGKGESGKHTPAASSAGVIIDAMYLSHDRKAARLRGATLNQIDHTHVNEAADDEHFGMGYVRAAADNRKAVEAQNERQKKDGKARFRNLRNIIRSVVDVKRMSAPSAGSGPGKTSSTNPSAGSTGTSSASPSRRGSLSFSSSSVGGDAGVGVKSGKDLIGAGLRPAPIIIQSNDSVKLHRKLKRTPSSSSGHSPLERKRSLHGVDNSVSGFDFAASTSASSYSAAGSNGNPLRTPTHISQQTVKRQGTKVVLRQNSVVVNVDAVYQQVRQAAAVASAANKFGALLKRDQGGGSGRSSRIRGTRSSVSLSSGGIGGGGGGGGADDMSVLTADSDQTEYDDHMIVMEQLQNYIDSKSSEQSNKINFGRGTQFGLSTSDGWGESMKKAAKELNNAASPTGHVLGQKNRSGGSPQDLPSNRRKSSGVYAKAVSNSEFLSDEKAALAAQAISAYTSKTLVPGESAAVNVPSPGGGLMRSAAGRDSMKRAERFRQMRAGNVLGAGATAANFSRRNSINPNSSSNGSSRSGSISLTAAGGAAGENTYANVAAAAAAAVNNLDVGGGKGTGGGDYPRYSQFKSNSWDDPNEDEFQEDFNDLAEFAEKMSAATIRNQSMKAHGGSTKTLAKRVMSRAKLSYRDLFSATGTGTGTGAGGSGASSAAVSAAPSVEDFA